MLCEGFGGQRPHKSFSNRRACCVGGLLHTDPQERAKTTSFVCVCVCPLVFGLWRVCFPFPPVSLGPAGDCPLLCVCAVATAFGPVVSAEVAGHGGVYCERNTERNTKKYPEVVLPPRRNCSTKLFYKQQKTVRPSGEEGLVRES